MQIWRRACEVAATGLQPNDPHRALKGLGPNEYARMTMPPAAESLEGRSEKPGAPAVRQFAKDASGKRQRYRGLFSFAVGNGGGGYGANWATALAQ